MWSTSTSGPSSTPSTKSVTRLSFLRSSGCAALVTASPTASCATSSTTTSAMLAGSGCTTVLAKSSGRRRVPRRLKELVETHRSAPDGLVRQQRAPPLTFRGDPELVVEPEQMGLDRGLADGEL